MARAASRVDPARVNSRAAMVTVEAGRPSSIAIWFPLRDEANVCAAGQHQALQIAIAQKEIQNANTASPRSLR